MIEGCGDTEPSVDARIVFCRYIRNPVRVQKRDKLITRDIEKDVPKTPAFFDRYRVDANLLEAQNTLVKLARLVEVERRQANMGNSSVPHFRYSSRSDL